MSRIRANTAVSRDSEAVVSGAVEAVTKNGATMSVGTTVATAETAALAVSTTTTTVILPKTLTIGLRPVLRSSQDAVVAAVNIVEETNGVVVVSVAVVSSVVAVAAATRKASNAQRRGMASPNSRSRLLSNSLKLRLKRSSEE